MDRGKSKHFLGALGYVLALLYGLCIIFGNAESPDTFKCPEQFGYYPDMEDCTKYFICVFGDSLHEKCTGGLFFSAELQTCDWPRNVECANGLKPDDQPEQVPADNSGFNSNRRVTGQRSRNSQKSQTNLSNSTKFSSSLDSEDFEDFSRNSAVSRNSLPRPRTSTSTTTPSPSTRSTTQGPGYSPSRSPSLEPYLTDPTANTPFDQSSSEDPRLYDEEQSRSSSSLDNYDPQQPEFEEAAPPVIDSSGAIHIADGPHGSLDGIRTLPGVGDLSVFVKPLFNSGSSSKEADEDTRDYSKDQPSVHDGLSNKKLNSYIPGRNNGHPKDPDVQPSYNGPDTQARSYSSQEGTAPPPSYHDVDNTREYDQFDIITPRRLNKHYNQEPELIQDQPPQLSDALPVLRGNNGNHPKDVDAVVRGREFKPVPVTGLNPSHPDVIVVNKNNVRTRDPDVVLISNNNGNHKDSDVILVTNAGRQRNGDAVLIQNNPAKESEDLVSYYAKQLHQREPDPPNSQDDDPLRLSGEWKVIQSNNGNYKDYDVISTARDRKDRLYDNNRNRDQDYDTVFTGHSNNGNHKDPDAQGQSLRISNEKSQIHQKVQEPIPQAFAPLGDTFGNRQNQYEIKSIERPESVDSQYGVNPSVQIPRQGAPQNPKIGPQRDFVHPKEVSTEIPVEFGSNVRKTYGSYDSSPRRVPDHHHNDNIETTTRQTVYSVRTRGTPRTKRPTSTTAQPVTTTTTAPPIRTRTRRPSQQQTPLPNKQQKYTPGPIVFPARPPSVYTTPAPFAPASRCDSKKCRLPDCRCGGTDIPKGLPANDIPQIVLLTFDDAVNDLNFDLYNELFSTGRKNPNGCPILGTFYVSHEWTDYGHVQTLYSQGHEMASHSITHSYGEKFSKNQWLKEINGQREVLHLYGGVKLEDIRGMRAPFLQIGGNRMFEMLFEANFTYDSSMPVFENNPPYWPYTMDYAMSHECMITPCPSKSFPGLWEVGMVMWVDLRGGRCSMGDACSNPLDEEGVAKMLMKNFNRHYKSNRAPFGLFYHSAWFNTQHHRRGFIKFLDEILSKDDVYVITKWQLIQWMRDPKTVSEVKSFEPWQCWKNDRPPPCHNPTVCNVWYQGGVRYMKTCQQCPAKYPWVGNTGFEGRG